MAISKINPASMSQPMTLGTAVASTSGTSIDFTSIPSWVKRITVMFSGVSTNGSSLVQVQLGSGSVTTSGYIGGYSQISGTTIAGNNHTSGVIVQGRADASNLSVGSVQIDLVTANTYVASGSVYNASYGGYMTLSGSYVSLSGVLDRVRVTTVNGTDTFDAGSINILYEG